MKVSTIVCLVTILFSIAFAGNALKAVNDDIISIVNNHPTAKWKATHNKFSEWEVEDVKKLLGTVVPKERQSLLAGLPLMNNPVTADIPDNFDSRQQWPSCVHPIRDQAQCGSCWAFGASEALSDRFCIASKGTVNVVLSPQDLVSCDKTNYGCNGGMLNTAWSYMAKHGIVTETCLPYQSQTGNAPACPSACADGSARSSATYYAGSVYSVGGLLPWGRVAKIQEEIMTNGPVEAAFQVYQDFMSYSSGVYTHVSGSLLGGHAIKMVGWGVENGTPYWLIANSWGTGWGESGFFKILRGKNECGIESNVYTGLADLSRLPH